MNFTGFTRRIDNLGRIVIPKEIRNKLKLKPEDCMEISVEKEAIILTKKNLLSGSEKIIQGVIETLSKTFKNNIILTDINKFICCEGSIVRNLLDNELSNDIYKALWNRKSVIEENVNFLELTAISYVFEPIIVNGDIVSSVIIIRNNKNLDNVDLFSAQVIKELMIKSLEF